MSDASIRAVRVSKWYGKVTALQDVSLHLGPGIWGLLGPNGSGKTTFLRICAGQIRPAIGDVYVCGERPFANPSALRRIGLCPEADAMYDAMSGLEFVTTMAELSGYGRKEAATRAADALESFGLKDAQDRKIGAYSRGMRQRAKLAQAVVHDPSVLLLDEPLTGTDPSSRQRILSEIRRRAEGGAVVLFSTHVLPEIEAITDHVLLIARGNVVAQGRVHEIRDLMEDHPHHVRVYCDRPRELAAAMAAIEGVVGLRLAPQGVELQTATPDATYLAIAREVRRLGIRVHSLSSPDASLEALFHHLVERAQRGAGTGADAGVGSVMPALHQGAAQQAASPHGASPQGAAQPGAAQQVQAEAGYQPQINGPGGTP